MVAYLKYKLVLQTDNLIQDFKHFFEIFEQDIASEKSEEKIIEYQDRKLTKSELFNMLESLTEEQKKGISVRLHHKILGWPDVGFTPRNKYSDFDYIFISHINPDRIPEHNIELSGVGTFFRKVIKSMNILYIALDRGYGDGEPDFPPSSEIEYFQNPYLLCIEPKAKRSRDRVSYDFLYKEPEIMKRAKKLITPKEILGIIERHFSDEIKIKHFSDEIKIKIFEKKKGIGFVKISPLRAGYGAWDYKLRIIYPRYFIRKELRRRGLKLKEGLAEKYAKELKIK